MITKVEAWKTSDGTLYEILDAKSLDHAKAYEIAAIVSKAAPKDLSEIPDLIMAAKDQILDIWTTGPKSRPKARKANGAVRKPRAVKTEAAT